LHPLSTRKRAPNGFEVLTGELEEAEEEHQGKHRGEFHSPVHPTP
jgi:hypothetical protein